MCYRDAWGVPHLKAPDANALAFAQGRNAAVDRGWQIEAARRRAAGNASASFGADWAHWDRLVRRAGVVGSAKAAFEALDSGTAAWVRAYVDGVNSGMATGTALAPELDAVPEPWDPWTPLSVWYGEHLLFGGGFPGKLWRELVRDALGERAVRAFALDGPEPVGSNGWLVDGSMTASGKPILAGDPHRAIQLPGAYQQIRLACDEFDVVGLAIPGTPGIAHFGHTGDVAWGITNAMADTCDVFRERLRRGPDGSVEAFGPGGWEPASVRSETYTVAGGETQTVEIVETARGPVVGEDAKGPFSMRGPLQELPDLGFAALPKLLRARTVDDVDAAMEHWVLPVNVVMAADAAGRTLHRVAGRVPERDEENRRHPVPAWEAKHAWRGWKTMPRKDIDRVATMANERGLSAPLGVEFCPPHRANRIRTLLEERTGWAAADMAAIHTDTLQPSADVLLRPLEGVELAPESAKLLDRMRDWDRRMDADSVEAAAFAAYRAAAARRLAALPVFADLGVPEGADPTFVPWLLLRNRIGYVVEHVLGFVGRAEAERVLRAALDDVAGEEFATWGEVHRLRPWEHQPIGFAPAAPLGGNAGDVDCVLATSCIPGATEDFSGGPAARWVWDLADREQSRWIVPFGTSGTPGPHHRDQFPLWRDGELIPVVTEWPRLQEEYRMIDRPAVFEQTLDGFGTVSIVPVRPKEDLDLIYGWVTQERARFWGMTEHSRDYVLEIYEYLDSLDTHHAYLLLRDAKPVALFQTYEPDADPVGECYEVEPGDIGVHLLVAAADGKAETGFTVALLKVIGAHLFADPGHRRIVAEPDTRNAQASARLRRSGFAIGPEITLPDKTARLAFLRREDAPAGLL
ncbi:hypothetical protein GCM10009783_53840 [Glycomyces lechevalierae]